MTTAQQVAEFLGLDVADWSEVQKSGIWFRVQPAGLGLDHNSITSNECEDNGIHVVETLEQAMELEGNWIYRKTPHEVIVISGPNSLRDTGDVEGYVLPAGSGEIIARFDFQKLDTEYNDS